MMNAKVIAVLLGVLVLIGIGLTTAFLKEDPVPATPTAENPDEADEQPDPLNANLFIEPKDDERPDHDEDDVDSVVGLPAALSRTWAMPRSDCAIGSSNAI